MINYINVLIVDDHPFIIEVYKGAFAELEKANPDKRFNIITSTNCDDAITYIKESHGCNAFDLIVLDMSLPKAKQELLFSGEEIGKVFKKTHPEGKIIVITALNDNYRLNSILDTLNPDGFLIKSDINSNQLKESFKTVIEEPPYYSKTVLKLMRKKMDNGFVVDAIDKQLLYQLSIGAKMKDISNTIHLSVGGLERRKRHLKETFKVNEKDNRTLIELAREKGFI